MSAIVHSLFALLVALSAATGTPQDNAKLHPQTPVFIPAAIQVSQDITPTNSVEITGTIQSVTNTGGITGTTTIVLTSGVTVTTDIHTEKNGNLKPGMMVSIEGTLQPDGSIVATEIKPGLGQGDDKSNGEDKGKGDDKNTDVITATLTITNGREIDDDGVITGTKSITDVHSTDDKDKSHAGVDNDNSSGGGNGGMPKGNDSNRGAGNFANFTNTQWNGGDNNGSQPKGSTNTNSGQSPNHQDGGDNPQKQGDHSGGHH